MIEMLIGVSFQNSMILFDLYDLNEFNDLYDLCEELIIEED